MRILFERSGGFAGLTLSTELDTASLPPDEAHKVQNLVNAANFFHLPASIPASTRRADAFQYEVTVEEEGKRHTVRASEPAIPDALQPLFDYLTKMAKGKKGTVQQR